MTSATALPSLFISHGAPTFALEPGHIGPMLTALGEQLPTPRAVLVFSPHWMTRQSEIGSSLKPETIHDFGGFPAALYELQYPAAGSLAVAAEAQALLAAAGLPARLNPSQGLDHGAWVPLMHLYPDASVPVLQLSMQPDTDPRAAYALGRALAPLSRQGVLLLGSGGITHNLYDFRAGQAGTLPYVSEFSAWIETAIGNGDLEALFDYRRQAPGAVRAHPTDEHLMPLFFAIGAAGDAWTGHQRLIGGVEFGMLNMDSYLFAV
jgi:4,5-DOPA dioxygenase extradiol